VPTICYNASLQSDSSHRFKKIWSVGKGHPQR